LTSWSCNTLNLILRRRERSENSASSWQIVRDHNGSHF
jgi:hypothetical protein